jgi:hypothetical protein
MSRTQQLLLVTFESKALSAHPRDAAEGKASYLGRTTNVASLVPVTTSIEACVYVRPMPFSVHDPGVM